MTVQVTNLINESIVLTSVGSYALKPFETKRFENLTALTSELSDLDLRRKIQAEVVGADSVLTPEEVATVKALSTGFLLRVIGGDTSIPAAEYLAAYRGDQGDFSYLKDQSGQLRDAVLNSALFPPARANAATYTVGQYVTPAELNGNIYKCTAQTGATAGSQPAGFTSTAIGGTITDGGVTWTVEKGPWYVESTTGRRQFRTLANGQIGAAGSIRLPRLLWNLAAGDSLIVSLSGAFDFAGQGNERVILSNQSSAGGVTPGFSIRASEAFDDLRINFADGLSVIQTGHTKASFGQNPLDGTFRTTTFMVDGPSKMVYAYHDGTPYIQSDMFDAANLAPNNFSIATLTGSTQSAVDLCLGGQIQRVMWC